MRPGAGLVLDNSRSTKVERKRGVDSAPEIRRSIQARRRSRISPTSASIARAQAARCPSLAITHEWPRSRRPRSTSLAGIPGNPDGGREYPPFGGLNSRASS